MSGINPKANWFFDKETPWKKPCGNLRILALECGLIDKLKWGCPTYTIEGKHVVTIQGFKYHCALLFHEGVLLKNNDGTLIQQTANVQSAQHIRFRGLHEIVEMGSG